MDTGATDSLGLTAVGFTSSWKLKEESVKNKKIKISMTGKA